MMKLVSGTVFNIQSFSVHDGPGIRTTVFLKGCPLNCQWCHNPEGLHPMPELLTDWKKCINCNKCIASCPNGALKISNGKIFFNKNLCTVCGACIDVCPGGVFERTGSTMNVIQVLDIVGKDRAYFGAEGGVTFSGGEPLNQIDFLEALLKEAKKRGFRTAVDTSGYSPWGNYKRILNWTDLFLYDFKCFDLNNHIEKTGVPNDRIKENLSKLSEKKARIWIRIPIIPGINDDSDNIERTAKFLSGLNIEAVEPIPYHKIGSNKYKLLDVPYYGTDFRTPSTDELKSIIDILIRHGLHVRSTNK